MIAKSNNANPLRDGLDQVFERSKLRRRNGELA